MLEALARDGVVTVPDVMGSEEVDALLAHLEPLVGPGAGDRSLHRDPVVWELAASGVLMALARQVLGEARVVRIIYFDKHPEANWKVPYHQDVTIAVKERHEVEGFGGWSVKEEMVHVRAPAEVLQRMVAVRLHLDDCDANNGPLRAIPGSHLHGRLTKEKANEVVASSEEEVCTCPRGGCILMRPLTLHASSQAVSPSHRRVLHVEYASGGLPGGLEWGLGA